MDQCLCRKLLCRALGIMVSLGLLAAQGTPLAAAHPVVDNGSQNPTSLSRSPLDDHIQASYGQLPLSFEANLGQADPAVNFLARGQGYSLTLDPSGALLTFQTASSDAESTTSDQALVDLPAARVHLSLLGANPQSDPQALDPLPGRVNYLIGDDPSQWQTDILTYASVTYASVYPGIDLVYDGSQGQLEYTFKVAPGSDPSAIRLGIDGASSTELGADGALVVHTAAGDLRQPTPVIYQEIEGARQPVSGGYVLADGDQVGFALGAYDTSRPLIIDPVLVYSTFLGGTNSVSSGIAVDTHGNAYLAGFTQSPALPTTPGAPQRAYHGAGDAFVTKLNATGTAELYSTYIGGTGIDQADSIAIDSTGNAYVAGLTQSTDFPVTSGAFQTSLHGSAPTPENAWVAKLNPNGTALTYSTYLGGTGQDLASGIAVDAAGHAFVTGGTQSPDFPTTSGVLQATFRGGSPISGDAFVTEVNATGTGLIYSTYLGGNSYDDATGIALDSSGNVYVAGITDSSGSNNLPNNFPTTPGAFRTTCTLPAAEGLRCGFVAKINPRATTLVYSTVIGDGASIGGIALSVGDTAVISGVSGDFPTTPGAYQPSKPSGHTSGFVTRLNAQGTGLVYSTWLGGRFVEEGAAVATDSTGNAYVTTQTQSINFPVTPDAFQSTFGGNRDSTITKFSPSGALIYSSYLRDNGETDASAIAADGDGNAYVTGSTNSSDFPTTPGVVQTTFQTPLSGFVTKIGPQAPPRCQLTGTGNNASGQRFIQITTQDAGIGLQSIKVTEALNATVDIPAFTPGARTPIVVTATKVNQSTGATVALRVTNQVGGFIDCDPALLTVGREPGESPVQVLHHIAQGESHLSVVNGTPGVDRLRVDVNGHRFEMQHLQDGETRMLDVSSAMRQGVRNTLLVMSRGPRGGSAVVIVSDSP